MKGYHTAKKPTVVSVGFVQPFAYQRHQLCNENKQVSAQNFLCSLVIGEYDWKLTNDTT